MRTGRSPDFELQRAMSSALLGNAAVTALVGGAVLDELSAFGQPYPYIQIGHDQIIGHDGAPTDWSEIYSTVHIYADGPRGRELAKQIAGAVRDVLSDPLTLPSHVMPSAEFKSSLHMTSDDPTNPGAVVAHSVLVFHYHTQPRPS